MFHPSIGAGAPQPHASPARVTPGELEWVNEQALHRTRGCGRLALNAWRGYHELVNSAVNQWTSEIDHGEVRIRSAQPGDASTPAIPDTTLSCGGPGVRQRLQPACCMAAKRTSLHPQQAVGRLRGPTLWKQHRVANQWQRTSAAGCVAGPWRCWCWCPCSWFGEHSHEGPADEHLHHPAALCPSSPASTPTAPGSPTNHGSTC